LTSVNSNKKIRIFLRTALQTTWRPPSDKLAVNKGVVALFRLPVTSQTRHKLSSCIPLYVTSSIFSIQTPRTGMHGMTSIYVNQPISQSISLFQTAPSKNYTTTNNIQNDMQWLSRVKIP